MVSRISNPYSRKAWCSSEIHETTTAFNWPASSPQREKQPLPTCSDSGVLKTRFGPNLSRRSTEHRKTPPNATSSPKTHALHAHQSQRKLSHQPGIGKHSTCIAVREPQQPPKILSESLSSSAATSTSHCDRCPDRPERPTVGNEKWQPFWAAGRLESGDSLEVCLLVALKGQCCQQPGVNTQLCFEWEHYSL